MDASPADTSSRNTVSRSSSAIRSTSAEAWEAVSDEGFGEQAERIPINPRKREKSSSTDLAGSEDIDESGDVDESEDRDVLVLMMEDFEVVEDCSSTC